jgi:hypothetical protein
MSLSQRGGVRIGTHELAVDNRKHVVEDGAPLNFSWRVHGAYL